MSQKYLPGQPQRCHVTTTSYANYKAEHVLFEVKDGVATLTLNRPERKNPLSFESYAELRDLFQVHLSYAEDVHAIVITGAGDKFLFWR
jgi:enoyl-CoA hydratase/carnithine racemase